MRLVEGLTKSELVRKYEPKVRIMAQGISGKMPRNCSDVEDLVSVGFIGLMDAADKFEASRGIKFATYAEFRIRGAILDELRSLDAVPRSVRMQAKKIEQVANRFQNQTGRTPSDTDISKVLKISREDFQELKARIAPIHHVNFDDVANRAAAGDAEAHASETSEGQPIHTSGSAHDPSIRVMRLETRDYLDQLFKNLSDDQRMVLTFYYYRGLNLGEIAMILEVSESRVSQIHSAAIGKLREFVHRSVPDTRNLFLMLLAA